MTCLAAEQTLDYRAVCTRLTQQFRGLLSPEDVASCLAASRAALRRHHLDSPENALRLARAAIEVRLARSGRPARFGT